MKTLVEDEFEPRPQGPTISSGTNTSSSMTTSVNVNFTFVPTTDPQPRGPIRTQAFVDRHRELGQ